MAKSNSLLLLSLSVGLLVFLNGCIGKQDWSQQQGECQIQRINAAEPNDLIRAEGGETEFWDHNDEQFRCAGVAVRRHTIHRQGLLLPSYTNAPLLVYIIQGKGILGVLAPGCAETFQTSQQSFEQERRQQGRPEREEFSSEDRHQRIQHFRQGDIIAIPAGAAHWTYNNGEEDLVAVVLFDTTNNDNQLDQNPRRFFIAGNIQGQQQQGQQEQWGRRQSKSRHGQQQQQGSGNVFAGFETRTLSLAFGVPEETARKLQGEQDNRGHIVRVESGLQVLTPPKTREEQSQRPGNGIEETVCSARLIENLDDPSRADIYNPQAGRLSTVNNYNLPVLSWLKLSAERGILKRNAIMTPYWSVNSHKIIYATRGDARIQIVNENGEAVFDDQLREGQIVVAPQNFAVLKQAGNRGFDWVAFRTNENAVINTLAGRTSAFRGLPVDVVANAYQVSREDAQKLKFNREETLLFASGSESGRVSSA